MSAQELLNSRVGRLVTGQRIGLAGILIAAASASVLLIHEGDRQLIWMTWASIAVVLLSPGFIKQVYIRYGLVHRMIGSGLVTTLIGGRFKGFRIQADGRGEILRHGGISVLITITGSFSTVFFALCWLLMSADDFGRLAGPPFFALLYGLTILKAVGKRARMACLFTLVIALAMCALREQPFILTGTMNLFGIILLWAGLRELLLHRTPLFNRRRVSR